MRTIYASVLALAVTASIAVVTKVETPPPGEAQPANTMVVRAPVAEASTDGAEEFSGTQGRRTLPTDCDECPEMVVLPGTGIAMGRYEVTLREYREFAEATNRTGDTRWRATSSFTQSEEHPVAHVSWHDAEAYAAWLSSRTGATYRLPTEAEWEQAAAGSEPGCDMRGAGIRQNGTCVVGSHNPNPAGLSDMIGNVWEWTDDCWEDDCDRRVTRGGSWADAPDNLSVDARFGAATGQHVSIFGFRVVRTLD